MHPLQTACLPQMNKTGRSAIAAPESVLGGLHAWAYCQHMCDSEVKRFIFSIHQVPKSINYFTCTRGKNKVRDLFQHWETLAIPDTLRENMAAPCGASLSLRKAAVDPYSAFALWVTSVPNAHMRCHSIKVTWWSWVPTMQCAGTWSNMYGFLRKETQLQDQHGLLLKQRLISWNCWRFKSHPQASHSWSWKLVSSSPTVVPSDI